MREQLEKLQEHSYAYYFTRTSVPAFCVLLYLLFFINLNISVLFFYIIFYFIIYIYGINIFYHRFWCHHQFTSNSIIVKFFTVAGLFAMIGGPTFYTLAHRWHHANSDTDLDPHSPSHGRWHAFVGWIFNSNKISIPIKVIKDFLQPKNTWIFFLERNKISIVWIGVLIALLIGPNFTAGLLLSMFTAHFIELYINAWLHDIKLKQGKNANIFLCWITAGGLMHKLHHDNSKQVTKEDPGYYFIKIVSTNEKT